MEAIDVAAVRPARSLVAELVEHAAALARREQPKWSRRALLPRELRAALERSDQRARRVPAGLGEVVALDFLGDAVAAIAVDHGFDPGEAEAAVVAVADVLGVPDDLTRFLVFRRALASKEWIQLPATVAAELAVSLLLELAPAAAASLWVLDSDGATTCLVGQGTAAQSRGIRHVARAALDGLVACSGQIRARLVDRWDRPYAALVARGHGDPAHLDPYLAEAATALAPVLERAADVDRELEYEHDAVAAGERHVVRLGLDLHDGPLQELVALAEELRLVSAQVDTVVSDADRRRIRGRFDDVHARLGALDENLREIARGTRSTVAAAQPVEAALESQLRALERATGIETELEVDGDLDGLTESQRITLFRIVQEALSNVRKHSGASNVSVVLHSTRAFLDLTITDDGRGFDPGRLAGDRLGLAGIAERVRLLGGVVEIKGRPGAGASVRATLPQWRPSRRGVAALSAAEIW